MACYLVTGGGGFIGTNLARALVARGDEVRVLDDFSTGRRGNLQDLSPSVQVFEGSICDPDLLERAMAGADYCLHQAAVPSVPRSIDDPIRTNMVNVEGTLRVFLAARDAGVRRVVYASSSSVYGDGVPLPVSEEAVPRPISPYGVSKRAVELYASVFQRIYGLDLVGLRYFNVFGPHQDPASQYAAVVPLFITRMLRGERPLIHGDGRQSRDFSYVSNVVEANLKACEPEVPIAGVYNVACGATTTLCELVAALNECMGLRIEPEFDAPRAGDIRVSRADVSRARDAFGYVPTVDVREGLALTVDWYRREGVPSCRT